MGCVNGSEIKPGSPLSAWVSTSYGQEDFVSRAARAIGVQPSFFIDSVPNFCSLAPPEIQEYDLGDLANPVTLFTKMVANSKAIYWYDVCRCKENVQNCETVKFADLPVTVIGNNDQRRVSIRTSGSWSASVGGSAVVAALSPGWRIDYQYPPFVPANQWTLRNNSLGQEVGGAGHPDITFCASGFVPDTQAPPVPPVYPPIAPPPPENPPMSPQDKAELLAAIQQCYCPPGDGSAGVDLTEIIQRLTVLRDTTIPKVTTDLRKEILKTVPEYRVLVAEIKTIPGNASYTLNPSGSRKYVAGWIMFKEEGKLYPREFITFEKSVFIAPVPGKTLTYEYYLTPGFAVDFALGLIKINNGEAETV